MLDSKKENFINFKEEKMAFRINTSVYRTPFVPEQSTQKPQSPEEDDSSNSTTDTNQTPDNPSEGEVDDNLGSSSNSTFGSALADWLKKEFGLDLDLDTLDEDKLRELLSKIDNPSDDFIAQLLQALKNQGSF